MTVNVKNYHKSSCRKRTERSVVNGTYETRTPTKALTLLTRDAARYPLGDNRAMRGAGEFTLDLLHR